MIFISSPAEISASEYSVRPKKNSFRRIIVQWNISKKKLFSIAKLRLVYIWNSLAFKNKPGEAPKSLGGKNCSRAFIHPRRVKLMPFTPRMFLNYSSIPHKQVSKTKTWGHRAIWRPRYHFQSDMPQKSSKRDFQPLAVKIDKT